MINDKWFVYFLSMIQARPLPTPYPKHWPYCCVKLVTSLLRHVIQYGGQQLVGSACSDFGTAFPKCNATNRACCTPRQSGKVTFCYHSKSVQIDVYELESVFENNLTTRLTVRLATTYFAVVCKPKTAFKHGLNLLVCGSVVCSCSAK